MTSVIIGILVGLLLVLLTTGGGPTRRAFVRPAPLALTLLVSAGLWVFILTAIGGLWR
jgi:hypothetical protein